MHTEFDGIRRTATIGVDRKTRTWIATSELVDKGNRRITFVVDDYDDLGIDLDRFTHSFENRNDSLALLIGGNDDRDPGCQRRTPASRQFHTSTIGRSVTNVRYSGCGAPMMRMSDRESTSSSDNNDASVVT